MTNTKAAGFRAPNSFLVRSCEVDGVLISSAWSLHPPILAVRFSLAFHLRTYQSKDLALSQDTSEQVLSKAGITMSYVIMALNKVANFEGPKRRYEFDLGQAITYVRTYVRRTYDVVLLFLQSFHVAFSVA